MDSFAQLSSAILAQNLPPPSPVLLHAVISSRSPPPPLPSLVATARARILAGDITSSSVVDPSAPLLPEFGPTAKEVRLAQDVHLQVLDIEDLSRSRWSQAEELEAVERGEMTRGREVIRVRAEDEASSASQGLNTAQPPGGGGSGANAMHRLVLQDRSGKTVFAMELRRVTHIGLQKTSIGEKILLRSGTVIARANVLLTPENCVSLGGKVEAWHRTWAEERLARLKTHTINGPS